MASGSRSRRICTRGYGEQVMEPDVTIISNLLNLGVASAIAIYLVYYVTQRLNSKIDELTSTIRQLNDSIQKLIYKLEASGR